MYIHELPEWPAFTSDSERLIGPLAGLRHLHGRLLGRLEALGFLNLTANQLANLTQDVIKSTEIEGERLNVDQVRSSIAHRLGIEIPSPVAASREVDGMVDVTLDALHNCGQPLTRKRLWAWQAALFPARRSGLYQIRTGAWRDDAKGPMQVVSGGFGRERVHFQAPDASRVPAEMRQFLTWYNRDSSQDPVLKAATAHLWFVTIHPFDDGNGRVARALTDLLMARSDGRTQRFYSMSAQIMKQRNEYYKILESTQQGTLDITDWLLWFVECLTRALEHAETTIAKVLQRHQFWQRHQSVVFNERHHKLLPLLLDEFEGKLTTSKWAKIAKCSTDTALRDIQFLLSHGILEKEEASGRSTSYRLAR